jgi:hypothetical protein
MLIKLNNVRLSFPELFQAKSVNNSEPRFGASFLLDKQANATEIESIKTGMKAVAEEKWGANIPKGVKKCLHEGAEKEYDGYSADNMFISATNKKRPTVVDYDMSPLTAEDGRPYGGCYVNAVVRLWAQDNQFGKRINAQLQGVQFAKHGEAFGAGSFNPSEHFGPLEAPAPAPTTAGSADEDEVPF